MYNKGSSLTTIPHGPQAVVFASFVFSQNVQYPCLLAWSAISFSHFWACRTSWSTFPKLYSGKLLTYHSHCVQVIIIGSRYVHVSYTFIGGTNYGKECLRFCNDQVGCDNCSQAIGMLTLCKTGKISPILQLFSVYNVPFLVDTSVTMQKQNTQPTQPRMQYLVSESWHHEVCCRESISPSHSQHDNQSLAACVSGHSNHVYPHEWCRLLDAQLGYISHIIRESSASYELRLRRSSHSLRCHNPSNSYIPPWKLGIINSIHDHYTRGAQKAYTSYRHTWDKRHSFLDKAHIRSSSKDFV